MKGEDGNTYIFYLEMLENGKEAKVQDTCLIQINCKGHRGQKNVRTVCMIRVLKLCNKRSKIKENSLLVLFLFDQLEKQHT